MNTLRLALVRVSFLGGLLALSLLVFSNVSHADQKALEKESPYLSLIFRLPNDWVRFAAQKEPLRLVRAERFRLDWRDPRKGPRVGHTPSIGTLFLAFHAVGQGNKALTLLISMQSKTFATGRVLTHFHAETYPTGSKPYPKNSTTPEAFSAITMSFLRLLFKHSEAVVAVLLKHAPELGQKKRMYRHPAQLFKRLVFSQQGAIRSFDATLQVRPNRMEAKRVLLVLRLSKEGKKSGFSLVRWSPVK